MKFYELTAEEEKLLKDTESGAYVSTVELAKEKKKYQKIATATLAKTKNINIRLPEKTLLKLKARAASANIPYQTLAASVLHKFVVNEDSPTYKI